MRQLGSWATAWVTVGFGAVAYAGPPVEVEVIVEGEVESDALFSEEDDTATRPDETRVRTNRDGAPSVNTQVLSVTINNDGKEEREREMEALEQDMAEARERFRSRTPLPAPAPSPSETSASPGPDAETPAPPPQVEDDVPEPTDHDRREKRKHGGFRAGDSLVYYRAGDLAAGFGFEHMVVDRVSLTLSGGWLSAKEDEDGEHRRPSDRFLPAAALDRTRGFLLEGGMNLHFLNTKHWNAYGSIGLANVNYSIDGSERLRGGSVYGRLGGGVRWIWNRLHVAFDLGWYPYEVARYEDHSPDAEGEVIQLADAERVDSNRLLGTWYVGWRF